MGAQKKVRHHSHEISRLNSEQGRSDIGFNIPGNVACSAAGSVEPSVLTQEHDHWFESGGLPVTHRNVLIQDHSFYLTNQQLAPVGVQVQLPYILDNVVMTEVLDASIQ